MFQKTCWLALIFVVTMFWQSCLFIFVYRIIMFISIPPRQPTIWGRPFVVSTWILSCFAFGKSMCFDYQKQTVGCLTSWELCVWLYCVGLALLFWLLWRLFFAYYFLIWDYCCWLTWRCFLINMCPAFWLFAALNYALLTDVELVFDYMPCFKIIFGTIGSVFFGSFCWTRRFF